MDPSKDDVDANPPNNCKDDKENVECVAENGSGDKTDAFPYK